MYGIAELRHLLICTELFSSPRGYIVRLNYNNNFFFKYINIFRKHNTYFYFVLKSLMSIYEPKIIRKCINNILYAIASFIIIIIIINIWCDIICNMYANYNILWKKLGMLIFSKLLN